MSKKSKSLVPISNQTIVAPLTPSVQGFPVPVPAKPKDKVEYSITDQGKYAKIDASTEQENSVTLIPIKKDGTAGKAYKILKQK